METIYNVFFWLGFIIVGVSNIVTLYRLCSKKWTLAKGFKFQLFPLNFFYELIMAIAGALLILIHEFELCDRTRILGLWLIFFDSFLISILTPNIHKKENQKVNEFY